MIPPQELKNKSFTRSAKGYEIAEVDEYVDFIIERYSEIFAQCAKYDQKLRVVSSRISEIQQEEELIRRLSISTQKNSDRIAAEAEAEAQSIISKAHEKADHILGEARQKAQDALAKIEQKAAMQVESTQKKSDALLLSTRTRCTKLLGDFKRELSAQLDNISKIKTISEEFNAQLLSMYKNHLNLLSDNTSIPSLDLERFTQAGLYETILQEIKSDAAEIANQNAGQSYDFDEELGILKESRAAIFDQPDQYDKKEQKEQKEEPARPQEQKDEFEGDEFDTFENDSYDDDEDVKIFDKSARTENPEETDAANRASEPEKEEEFYEKPRSTYDSDDYEYEANAEPDFDANYEDPAEDEAYGDDLEPDEQAYDEEDEADEDEVEKKPKGFFGIFKKNKKDTKKHGGKSSKIDEDDGEEESLDIFEDLDDE